LSLLANNASRPLSVPLGRVNAHKLKPGDDGTCVTYGSSFQSVLWGAAV
jgi:hypothetical protein